MIPDFFIGAGLFVGALAIFVLACAFVYVFGFLSNTLSSIFKGKK